RRPGRPQRRVPTPDGLLLARARYAGDDREARAPRTRDAGLHARQRVDRRRRGDAAPARPVTAALTPVPAPGAPTPGSSARPAASRAARRAAAAAPGARAARRTRRA